MKSEALQQLNVQKMCNLFALLTSLRQLRSTTTFWLSCNYHQTQHTQLTVEYLGVRKIYNKFCCTGGIL